ncbi:MAG: biotin--[acetyl-CoA-carboxylase] ligase [Bacteroidia bacterium]
MEFQGIDWIGDWLCANTPACDSTMEAIEPLLAQSGAHSVFLYTLNQQAGRGQMGRKWVEEPGRSLALTVSYAQGKWGPNPDWVRINKQLSASVLLALQKVCAQPLQLKWPNDVYSPNGKVAGLLQELRGEHYLLGLGVNLQPFAQSYGLYADSLWPEGSPRFSELIENLMHGLRLEQVLEMPVERFEENLLFLGQEVRIEWANGVVQEAQFLGVDEQGRAGLRIEEQVAYYPHGKVRLLPPA